METIQKDCGKQSHCFCLQMPRNRKYWLWICHRHSQSGWDLALCHMLGQDKLVSPGRAVTLGLQLGQQAMEALVECLVIAVPLFWIA